MLWAVLNTVMNFLVANGHLSEDKDMLWAVLNTAMNCLVAKHALYCLSKFCRLKNTIFHRDA